MNQLRDGKKDGILKASAGKIPKGREALVVALADSLSAHAAIELSDGTSGKRTVSQLDLLSSLFESMPAPVTEGRLGLSDPAGDGDGKPLDMSKLRGRF